MRLHSIKISGNVVCCHISFPQGRKGRVSVKASASGQWSPEAKPLARGLGTAAESPTKQNWPNRFQSSRARRVGDGQSLSVSV